MKSVSDNLKAFNIVEFLDNYQHKTGKRHSLVNPLTDNKDIDIGPKIEEDLIIQEPSSGDESEETTENSMFKIIPKLSEVLNCVYDPRAYTPIVRFCILIYHFRVQLKKQYLEWNYTWCLAI